LRLQKGGISAYATSVTRASTIDRTPQKDYFSIFLQIYWEMQDGQSWSLEPEILLCSALEKLDHDANDNGRSKRGESTLTMSFLAMKGFLGLCPRALYDAGNPTKEEFPKIG
jgi:hypothetical protein